MAEVDVNIDINVENNSSWELNEITNNVYHLHQAVQQEQHEESRWEKSLKRIRAAAANGARAVAKVTASVAALAAALGPAVSGLLAAGKAIGAFGKGMVHLLPLVAFLPSLIGGMQLLVRTAKLMGPGFAKAFEPILANFRNAKGEASDFTKHLQHIAEIGLKPLVEGFNRLNMPAIKKGMEGVAYYLNSIVAHTLLWLNTVSGQQLIRTITEGTVEAMGLLFPKVIRLVNAFGDLAARAGDKAILGLAGVIGRILDKLIKWAENTTIEDINRALSDLAGYGGKLKSTFSAIRDIGRWLAENEGAVKHFSDVAAGAAIALGIATGNIPAVVAGAVSLILNHWQQLKAPFAEAIGWIKNIADAWRRDAGRIAIAESMVKAFQAFRASFNDAIKDIGPKWQEFVSQLKQAWAEWAPLIKAWWDTGGKEAFKQAGAALGGFIIHLLEVAAVVAAAVKLIAQAFKWMVDFVLGALQTIINGAATAFGWAGEIGGKLKAAAAEFQKFRDSVNNALDGIDSMKTVRINASVYVTGGGNVVGGVDQRTGNSRNVGTSGLTGWQRMAEAFAGDRGGSRTGGPAALHAEVSNVIMLDGQPFRSYTDRVVLATERRRDWRAKTGRR